MTLSSSQKRDLQEYHTLPGTVHRAGDFAALRHQDDERHVVVELKPDNYRSADSAFGYDDIDRIVKRFPDGELSWNKAERLADDLYWKKRSER